MPKGLLVTVRTGSGQGDPISSNLFLLASEPLNRILAQNYRNLMYTTKGNLTIGPILFAMMTTSILYQLREGMIYDQSSTSTKNTQW
jgi:hypothetical protein